MLSFNALPNALLFAFLGLAAFAAVAALMCRSILSELWSRATIQSDVAAAIVIGAVLLSIATIVAAAVH